MSPAKRQNSKGEHKRTQIRQGAYLCFRDSGYHNTTVDAICAKVGISKGSFYWHYDSKQHVFIDILEVWSREVMDELYEQFEEAVVTENYLSAITWALERELHRGRALAPLWMEFNALAKQDRELQAALSKFYRRARTAIAEILRPVMEDRFGDAELQSVASTIFGAYLGLLIQEQSDTERADARRTVVRFMQVIGAVFGELPDNYRQTAKRKRISMPRPETATEAAAPRLSEQELGDFIKGAEEATQARLLLVRQMLLDRMPELSERLVVGWQVLTYRLGQDLFSIKTLPEGVRLSFHKGDTLTDSHGLLQGKGKTRRFVVVPPEGALSPGLMDLIDQSMPAVG